MCIDYGQKLEELQVVLDHLQIYMTISLYKDLTPNTTKPFFFLFDYKQIVMNNCNHDK